MDRTSLDSFRAFLGQPTWDDIVAGHDFGLVGQAEIQAWAAGMTQSPAVAELCALEGAGLRLFEPHLWAACAEATGKTPRPGSARWSRAQDRWRVAILQEALASEATLTLLAYRIERLYEQVGCPEDMLDMLTPSRVWSGTPATVDPAAVQRFLRQRFDSIDRFGQAS
jgi:hypothetical protein